MVVEIRGLPLKKVERVANAELAFIEAGPTDAEPTIVLLHGFPTHAYLWRHVIEGLRPWAHVLAPDLLGLGDTAVSPYADLSAPMQAEAIRDWLRQRETGPVVLVGHEQGGAVAQQLVANHPETAAGLVLIDSVAYDNWPIPLAAQMMRLARTPGLDTIAYAFDLPRRLAYSARLGFQRAVCEKTIMTAAVIDEYLRPVSTTEGRERARRFLLAGSNRYTMECEPALRAHTGPAAVVWGADDAFFSVSWGLRLAADLVQAGELRLVPFCGHLVPEERPDVIVDAVHAVAQQVRAAA